jgi:hypothetical protein
MRVLLTLLLAASGQASSWHSLLTADPGIFMNIIDPISGCPLIYILKPVVYAT